MTENVAKRGTVVIVLGTFEPFAGLDEMERLIADARARATRDGIRGLRIEVEATRGYYDDVDVTCQIIGVRDETDEEVALKAASTRARARCDAEQRRELYEKLRQAFEG